mmetsp:Transcript_29427/g.79101  ORF Transcript_29427/g.79101 Transcript_29427/m.79101 type:complete len:267 (-) Transcript_29427:881-1681(-)
MTKKRRTRTRMRTGRIPRKALSCLGALGRRLKRVQTEVLMPHSHGWTGSRQTARMTCLGWTWTKAKALLWHLPHSHHRLGQRPGRPVMLQGGIASAQQPSRLPRLRLVGRRSGLDWAKMPVPVSRLLLTGKTGCRQSQRIRQPLASAPSKLVARCPLPVEAGLHPTERFAFRSMCHPSAFSASSVPPSRSTVWADSTIGPTGEMSDRCRGRPPRCLRHSARGESHRSQCACGSSRCRHRSGSRSRPLRAQTTVPSLHLRSSRESRR